MRRAARGHRSSPWSRGWLPAVLGLAACATAACAPAQEQEAADRDGLAPREDYVPVAEALGEFIRREMEEKELPAVSIALVDGQDVVWAEGFGLADPTDDIPAGAGTIYRVGSVSKLFTDIGIMQLVERGEVDLDAPVTTYLPDFAPRNPYGTPITLRQLMSHRAGLVREPPVGNYFDESEPTLEATVRSLNDTELVYEPGARTKYSNAGIAVVGYVLQTLSGTPFPEHLETAVLEPIGMSRSAFEPDAGIREDLATAYMWTYDGRRFEAPAFQLGMAPAGSMYASVEELGRFLSVLFAGGRGPEGSVIAPETLERMWTPQFDSGEGGGGYGLGFALGELDGSRWIGHGGAIYGFATQLAALPDEGLGVVTVTTVDIANTVTGRIADVALRMMKAARAGEPLPRPLATEPLGRERADALEGRYGGSDRAVTLREYDGELFLIEDRGGHRARLRARGDTLIADGRLAFGTRVLPVADGIVVGGDTLSRAPEPRPEPVPERWGGLIGEYGWDHNTLYVLEEGGRLHALIEWFFQYPLEEVSEDVHAFPDRGLYAGERLFFERGADGRATRVVAASVDFPRRQVGTEGDEPFRIDPVRPVEELRQAALAAEPPEEEGEFREPDLVELRSLEPTIRYDIRYATTRNFMGAVFYGEPHAFLQRPAAEALVRAHRALGERGYGLLIHDAYRPWYVTKMFFDATPEDMKHFVADPADGSRHNRGAAVDLTLYDLETGEPVRMVSGYDEFSPRAYPRYPGETDRARWHRELLREAMEAEGFSVYEWEWWHFDYGDWRRYPILNRTFEEILPGAPGGAAGSSADIGAAGVGAPGVDRRAGGRR